MRATSSGGGAAPPPAGTQGRRKHATLPRHAAPLSRLALLLAAVLICSLRPPGAAAAAGASLAVRLTHHEGPSPAMAWRRAAAAALNGGGGLGGGGGGASRALLLRSERATVSGSVHTGYFTAPLQIGTPPQAFDLIVDTGSTMTYVPCKGCEHCGGHTSAPFDPAASSTSQNVGCGEPACAAAPAARCVTKRCYYSLAYAEASSSEGWLIRDVVGLSGAPGPPIPAVVGCVNFETGMIFSQKADGLIGLGNAHRALPGQLADSGQTARVFGLCFGFPSGGALLLGDAPLPAGAGPPAWTPLIGAGSNTFYTVSLEGIDIGTGPSEAPSAGAGAGRGASEAARARGFDALEADASAYGRGYGTVLDSGTTFTYLPRPAFEEVTARVTALLLLQGHAAKVQESDDGVDVCWDLPGTDGGPAAAWAVAARAFPDMRLRFGGGAVLMLPPQRYLFAVDDGRRFCLGFLDNGFEGTLIGGISTRDVLVIYDLERHRIGFSEADCDRLAPDTPASAGGGGGSVVTISGQGAGPGAVPAVGGANATAGGGGGRAAPGAAAAAAQAKAKGQEAELAAAGRPVAPVTAAMRQAGGGANGTAAAAAAAGPAAAGAASAAGAEARPQGTAQPLGGGGGAPDKGPEAGAGSAVTAGGKGSGQQGAAAAPGVAAQGQGGAAGSGGNGTAASEQQQGGGQQQGQGRPTPPGPQLPTGSPPPESEKAAAAAFEEGRGGGDDLGLRRGDDDGSGGGDGGSGGGNSSGGSSGAGEQQGGERAPPDVATAGLAASESGSSSGDGSSGDGSSVGGSSGGISGGGSGGGGSGRFIGLSVVAGAGLAAGLLALARAAGRWPFASATVPAGALSARRGSLKRALGLSGGYSRLNAGDPGDCELAALAASISMEPGQMEDFFAVDGLARAPSGARGGSLTGGGRGASSSSAGGGRGATGGGGGGEAAGGGGSGGAV